MAKKKYSFESATQMHRELLSERSEWEQEWREISDYLLPGRGIYQDFTRPTKRKLTSPRVINTAGEDALYVLTSGMHGGLTSPSRPWFRLEWADNELLEVEPLVAWLQDCQNRLHKALHNSNFYSIINNFYIEYAGFGTASMYLGEDTFNDYAPFRFELLTAGEYAFAAGPDGLPDPYFRTLFMTPHSLVKKFGKKVSKELRDSVERGTAGTHSRYVTVLECVKKEAYSADMPYTQTYWELQSTWHGSTSDRPVIAKGQRAVTQQPLAVYGFHEFPYPTSRWSTIGSDVYGIGPGSRSLPDIKRLQEMEKAFLMATHKAINPPVNAPARMKGKLNTLPGGRNWYSRPDQLVTPIENIRFDYQGVGMAVERVEQRIQRNFFNDIFLTAARDPNATPYKATEVTAREQEKMLRLGPVIERLQHEFLQPVVERCFNIMLRKELFLPIPPEYLEIMGEYNISLVSPLATAQRSVALQGINSFMSFLGQAAQFDQSILDNIDPDATAREYADITGVHYGVLRTTEEIQQIRQTRAQQMEAERQKQEQIQSMMLQSQLNKDRAEVMKTQSEAGMNLVEGQQARIEAGVA